MRRGALSTWREAERGHLLLVLLLVVADGLFVREDLDGDLDGIVVLRALIAGELETPALGA